MGDYSGERGEPPALNCGNINLLFDGFYLKLRSASADGAVIQAWHARSGTKENGTFDYSVARQQMANLGPIPAGDYWIQPVQLRTKSVFHRRSAWGDFRITIHPRTNTNTYSRGGFFIHGGDSFGSIGCIDLAYGMNSFASRLQALTPPPSRVCSTAPGQDCTIPLSVIYGAESVGEP
mgnify:CR=1 FL=1